jgi:hypothetical protein
LQFLEALDPFPVLLSQKLDALGQSGDAVSSLQVHFRVAHGLGYGLVFFVSI